LDDGIDLTWNLWWAEAAKYSVLPLDWRGSIRIKNCRRPIAAHHPHPVFAREGLDVGMDVGSAIDFTYKLPFAFTGKIAKVTIELGPMEVAPSKPEKKGGAKKRSGKSKTAA
jgi:hypothetical protein